MPDLSKLAVITVYFNPVGYQNRRDLYRNFEQHISQSGVYLFTVECIFQSAKLFGLPTQNFDVTSSNNRRHLQLTASSILWLKENLINIAVQHLPSRIEYIAWIDADIEFEQSDWPHLIINELQRYPIVQIFESALFLGPNGKSQVLRHDYSFGYSIRHNKPIDPRQYNHWYPHPGYGWAMRRASFNQIRGLYEYSILGSADLHFAFALLNRVDETIPKNLTDDYRQTVRHWSHRVTQVADYGNNVGYVPTRIFHYWHGDRQDRGYVDRWQILERHHYQPTQDIEKSVDTGLISLVNRRKTDRLQMSVRMIAIERDIVAYFLRRKEDKPSTLSEPIKKPKSLPKSLPKNLSKPAKVITTHFQSKPMWTSGPSGSHVDDHHMNWVDCTCPNHSFCHHDDDCPCSPYYTCHSDSHDSSDSDHHEHECEEQHGSIDHDQYPHETCEPGSTDFGSVDMSHETVDVGEPGSFY